MVGLVSYSTDIIGVFFTLDLNMPTTSTGTGRDVVGLVSYAEPPGRDRLSSGRPSSNASSSRGQQADMGMVNLAMDETSLDGRVSRGSQVGVTHCAKTLITIDSTNNC